MNIEFAYKISKKLSYKKTANGQQILYKIVSNLY